MITSPRNTSALRLLTTASLAAALMLGLAACGKKGSPQPPEAQKSEYTFPHAYPAPDTVVPSGAPTTPAESEAPTTQGADPFSIFRDGKRTRTKTY